MPYGYVLKDGEITIDPEEAAVVREIYDMYLSGSGRVTIAQNLNKRGIFNRRCQMELQFYTLYTLMKIYRTQYGRKHIRRMRPS